MPARLLRAAGTIVKTGITITNYKPLLLVPTASHLIQRRLVQASQFGYIVQFVVEQQ
jgi:hypothetical protein